MTANPDGSKAVAFECVRTTQPAPPPTPPSPSYTYRTDQELVQASSIVANPNGTKTVTFQCGLR